MQRYKSAIIANFGLMPVPFDCPLIHTVMPALEAAIDHIMNRHGVLLNY